MTTRIVPAVFAAVCLPCALSLLIAASGPGRAQTNDGGTTPSEEIRAADRFSEEEIDLYVRTVIRVREIDADYAERIDATDDVVEQQRIRFEARQAKVEAVREMGLTVRRYNDIERVARSDRAFQQEIDRRIEAADE